MQISVIGAGGIGSAIAAYLARAGHKVTLVFKQKDDADAVRAHGLHVTGVQTFSTQVDVLEWPATIPPSDLLVVAVKTYDTQEALRCALGVTVNMAISAQNGLQKEAILAEVLGGAYVGGSVIEITAMNQGGGCIFNPDVSLSHLGDLDGRDSPIIRETARVLSESGLPTKQTSDIRSIEWTKACQWIATSLLSVMTGYTYPLIFSTEWLSPLFVKIVRECAQIAKLEGARIVEAPSLFVNRLVDIPVSTACDWLREKGMRMTTAWGTSYKASMLLDVERGSKTEFEEIIGYVYAKAQEHGVQTPALDFAIRQIRNIVGSSLQTKAKTFATPKPARRVSRIAGGAQEWSEMCPKQD